jgi:hypothetical protein
MILLYRFFFDKTIKSLTNLTLVFKTFTLPGFKPGQSEGFEKLVPFLVVSGYIYVIFLVFVGFGGFEGFQVIFDGFGVIF